MYPWNGAAPTLSFIRRLLVLQGICGHDGAWPRLISMCCFPGVALRLLGRWKRQSEAEIEVQLSERDNRPDCAQCLSEGCWHMNRWECETWIGVHLLSPEIKQRAGGASNLFPSRWPPSGNSPGEQRSSRPANFSGKIKRRTLQKAKREKKRKREQNK